MSDEIYEHFAKFGRWDYTEVSDEGRRLLAEIIDTEIEPDSPIDDVLSAMATQASDGAIAAVAAMLGVDASDLKYTVAHWLECQDDPPPPIGVEGLQAALDETNRLMRD